MGGRCKKAQAQGKGRRTPFTAGIIVPSLSSARSQKRGETKSGLSREGKCEKEADRSSRSLPVEISPRTFCGVLPSKVTCGQTRKEGVGKKGQR